MRWAYKYNFFIITEILIAVRLRTTVTTSSSPVQVTSFMCTWSAFLGSGYIFFVINVISPALAAFLRFSGSSTTTVIDCTLISVDAKRE